MASGISVIVTTYNWPLALNRVLSGLCAQDFKHFEIIVADDGSRDDTRNLIHCWQEKSIVPIRHCWQEDDGFRAAMIRNRAAALAKYDYLVFLDGDCIPRPDFLTCHHDLQEPGWMIKGNRILLTQEFTHQILSNDIPVENWSLTKWFQARLKGNINRFLPLIHFPIKLGRKIAAHKWQGAKTCNLAMWRNDFFAVNGFDESFVGWGYEDSDLVIRLQRSKVLCKSGKFAVAVMHLWHKEQDREQEVANRMKLEETLHSTHIIANKGVNQYILEPL